MAIYDPQVNSIIYTQFREHSTNTYDVTEVSGSNLLVHTTELGRVTSSHFTIYANTSSAYTTLVYQNGAFRTISSDVGSIFYTNSESVPVTLGGINAGSTFDKTPITTMFDLLLYPYQYPAFSSFSMEVASPLEVGYTIPSGNHTFTWTTTNSSNISPNTVSIVDNTNSTTLATGLANDGIEIISLPLSIQHTTNTSHVWIISAVGMHSQTITKTYTINWLWRVYWGESSLNSLTESSIKSLRVNMLSSTGVYTYPFIGDPWKYKYIVYPSSFGLLTNFKDTATNLDVAMSGPPTVVLVTNLYGVPTNYNVHRSLNKLGGYINIQSS